MFEKGHILFVTSWENDGDKYNTLKVPVGSFLEGKMYLAILELFKSEGFGNTYIGRDIDHEEVLTAVNKVALEFGYKDFLKDTYHLSDFMYDLLGSCEYYFYRVFERGELYYFPETLKPLEIA